MSEHEATVLLAEFLADLDAERRKAGVQKQQLAAHLKVRASALSNMFNVNRRKRAVPPPWQRVESILRFCWSRQDFGDVPADRESAKARAAERAHALHRYLTRWRTKYEFFEEAIVRARSEPAAPGHSPAWPVSRGLYVLDSVEPPLKADPRDLPPSRLLAADNRVVDFTGREEWLETLEAWRADKAPTGALLIHGPGGQGKTRLAEKFAEDSDKADWLVLHARQPHSAEGDSISAGTPEVSADLLVVVDYSDRWQADHLLALFTDPVLRDSNRKVRVLLLARTTQWWQSVRHRLPGVPEPRTLTLDALALPGGQRQAAFQTALNCFAKAFDDIDPQAIDPGLNLDDDKFDLALTVHMAALVAVDAHANQTDFPRDPSLLSGYLLDREDEHWRKMREQRKISIGSATMSRAVFVATLTQGTTYDEGHDLLDQLRVSSALEPAQQILDDHTKCYPAPDGEMISLAPLQPDRLGEDYVALQVPGRRNPRNNPDGWTAGSAGAIGKLLATHLPDGGSRVQAVLTVLIEAANRWDHLLESVLTPALRLRPGLALAAGNYGLTALVCLLRSDEAMLELIEKQIPLRRHVNLDAGIAVLTSVLTERRLARTTDQAVRAQLYQNLGWRLSNAGRHDEALGATEAAIAAVRTWGWLNKASQEPEFLAATLTNLGSMFTHLDRVQDACDATTEAVTIYRKLSARPSAGHEPGLAGALMNHSAVLLRSGKTDEALTAAKDGLVIFRRLAQDHAEFKHNYAAAADNLSTIQAALGSMENARGTAELAETLYAELMVEDPSAHAADCAAAADNLSKILHTMSAIPEACEASTRAVALFMQLSESTPAHDSQLSTALIRQVDILIAAGRLDLAVDAGREAVKVSRRVARGNAEGFDADHAKALLWFARACSQASSALGKGLSAAEACADMYKQLATAASTTWVAEAEHLANTMREKLAGAPGSPWVNPTKTESTPDSR